MSYFNSNRAHTGPSLQVNENNSRIMEAGKVQRVSEPLTVASVVNQSGLDFTIGNAPVLYRAANGEIHENTTARQLYRMDNGNPLGGTVSNRFKVLQPAVLADIVDNVIYNASGYRIAAGGMLDGGAGMWFQAKSDGFNLSGDKVEHCIMFATDNTGRQASIFFQTSKRLFCLNQLQAAFGSSPYKVSVRHTTEWSESYQRGITQQVRGFADSAKQLENAADNMARTAMSDRQAVNYFAELYAEHDDKGNVTNESGLERVVNNIMDSYKHGPGASHIAAKGTQWGAINAVTHYIDHVTRARSDENRFKSALNGAGFNRKAKAIELIQGNDYKPAVAAGGQPLLLA